ncbi:MAG: hypothetical protein H8E10_19590 [Desulfobacterales bacterium]|nr:hypothetical protein [Desulfobacterales bacterium]MBL7173416.1 hypothetical protein [Desulfobacteraceae bacterium]
MKKYPSAQDHLQEANLFLGKTTFLKAYPQVESLDLTVEAHPIGPDGEHRFYRYSLENPPGEFCPCPNPRCSNGGFRIGIFLGQMIFDKQTQGTSEGLCVGREKTGRDYQMCPYLFKAEATVRYKSEEP